MSIQDISARKVDLANARQSLGNALAIYNNPQLLSDTSAPGRLRRLECAWAIEQAIVITYQLQDEPGAVSDRLSYLNHKIRQDTVSVVEACQTEEELDFIFPEIKRIHDSDLAVLQSWHNNVDWVRSLSPSELQMLQSADFSQLQASVNVQESTEKTALAAPPEQLFYEDSKPKSHPASLRDQLILMMKPELRDEYASYISRQAAVAGFKSLVPANLKQASDLTVANLYWYFQVRDESAATA